MINLMPMPNCIERIRGTVSFNNYQIIIENKYEKSVLLFNKELEERLLINEEDFCYSFEFIFNKQLKDEQYIIHMDSTLTHIEAGSEKAFFYATRTLSQLFNLKNKRKVKKITCKAYYIDDKPRFSYRSFMLDEVRHFFGAEQVKKYISILSDLKINTFHWHLSDDQGFRIDFATFPKLKEVASKRKKTKINSVNNDDWDYNEYAHCYSYHEIKDIIRYAKQRYVDIVPEIDLPGHTSAIVSAYPFLHCKDEQHEVRGDYGVFKEIMCCGKESTYEFTKKLIDELCILFKDSKFIHIGGDEVNHENYKNCPHCISKMKELNLDTTLQLQAHFSNEIAKHILNTTNKKVIMWHDGVQENSDPRIIMQYWDYRMDEEKINFINQGKTTIYSPCSQFYFNDPYGELPIVRSYDRGIHLTGLKRKAIKNIIGMECCLWTEWTRSKEKMDFITNPRLFAFSEASWTNTINHDFTSFVERVEKNDDFFKYYNIKRAPQHIYLARGEKYRQKVSKLYRDNEKEIEMKMANAYKH